MPLCTGTLSSIWISSTSSAGSRSASKMFYSSSCAPSEICFIVTTGGHGLCVWLLTTIEVATVSPALPSRDSSGVLTITTRFFPQVSFLFSFG